MLVVFPSWRTSAAAPSRTLCFHGAAVMAYRALSIWWALNGIEYRRPVLRPVKLTTNICCRAVPATGVRSRYRRIGLTVRRTTSGGCEIVTAGDCSVMASPYDQSGVAGADVTHPS